MAVAILVSTATPKCNNIIIFKHEKDDCSDESKEDTKSLKAMELKMVKCFAMGEIYEFEND